MANQDADVEFTDAELGALLALVCDATGFDFRDYARASMRRRIKSFAQLEGLASSSELLQLIRTDADCARRLVRAVTVHSTTMFRDPWVYAALREKVLPQLRTYPFVRIWHAGCSSGEEAYSLAILLDEEGLLARSRIYATDVSEVVLQKAKRGIYPLANVREYTQNYLKAGGHGELSRYYTAHHGSVLLHGSLRRNLVFAQHNLVTDGSFNEFNLVLCRNVMIYFNRALQDAVHQLLYQSLAQFGVLGLGDKESLQFSPRAACFEELDGRAKLYRRVQ